MSTIGLYTEVKEADFDHLQGLTGYTDQSPIPQSHYPGLTLELTLE